MNARDLVHPDLVAMLDHLPQRRYSDATLPEVRAQLKTMADALPPPGNDRVAVEQVVFPGHDGDPEVGGLLFRPSVRSTSAPAMLHIHGGGFVNGYPELGAPANQALAEALGCVILSVRYRRAPETPYPGPQRDCYAALAALFAGAEMWGIDPRRIGVAGDSAGGGLAAATCLRARDEGVFRVAFQQLLYPMLDDRTLPGSDLDPHAGGFVWTPENNAYGWRALIGGEPGGEGVADYCAPARATRLAGLPPTFIAVGSIDLFLEEDIEYSRRLVRAGVPTELHVYPGAFHGFIAVPGAAPTIAYERDRRDWLRAAMAS